MNFEWDEAKNKKNFKKHEVWFEQAQLVFWDSEAQTTFDEKHSSKEDRWIIIGLATDGPIMVVSFCYRKSEGMEFIRLISARKAEPQERRFYEKGI